MSRNYWPYDPTPYDDFFRKYGAEYGVDPHRLRAQAYVESRFNPTARSPVGARGLMQFMPATAGDYGVTDLDELDDLGNQTISPLPRPRAASPDDLEEISMSAQQRVRTDQM